MHPLRFPLLPFALRRAGAQSVASMKKARLATTKTLPRSAGTSSEGYLDKVAIAQRLGVKPRTVAEWANQGKLPAYRIGSYLRFKWAEVEQHLAAACRVAKEEQKEMKLAALTRAAATTKGHL